jgi:acyl-CoA thioesterase FadM
LRACGLRPEETFKNTEEGFGLPIVEAWGRFRRPSRYGDLLRVETRVQEIRAKAIIFRFDFFPETGEELLAEGTANLVAIDRTWRPRDLPERVRAAFQENKFFLNSHKTKVKIESSERNFQEGDTSDLQKKLTKILFNGEIKLIT